MQNCHAVTFLGSGQPDGACRMQGTPGGCTMARDMLSTPTEHEAMGTRTRASMRRSWASARGFTLTEMLIVIAMVAVLSAIALVGYRRYINQAQSGEAKTVIQMIRGGQETYKAEMLQYLNVSTTIGTYYPNG